MIFDVIFNVINISAIFLISFMYLLNVFATQGISIVKMSFGYLCICIAGFLVNFFLKMHIQQTIFQPHIAMYIYASYYILIFVFFCLAEFISNTKHLNSNYDTESLFFDSESDEKISRKEYEKTIDNINKSINQNKREIREIYGRLNDFLIKFNDTIDKL